MKYSILILVICLTACGKSERRVQCEWAIKTVNQMHISDSLQWDAVQRDSTIPKDQKFLYFPHDLGEKMNILITGCP